MASRAGVVVGVGLNRGAADFTERERQIVAVARLHLSGLVDALAAQQELRDRADTLWQAVLGCDLAVVHLDRAGAVVDATPLARRLLARYDPPGTADGGAAGAGRRLVGPARRPAGGVPSGGAAGAADAPPGALRSRRTTGSEREWYGGPACALGTASR